jgi:kynurenine formamidase
MAKRWKHRPEGSNWGEFGEDDQIGRLNLITPQRRLAAAAEIKAGINFSLSLPLDVPGGKGLLDSRTGPKLFGTPAYNTPLDILFKRRLGEAAPPAGCVDVSCDDGVTMYLQYSTQWDALCHFGGLFDADGDGVDEPLYYNGWSAEHMRMPDAGGPFAERLGIANMAAAGVQGRGVLVDIVREYGTERRSLTYRELSRAMDRQGVAVEAGDFLCLRTGYAEALWDMGEEIDRDRMARIGAVLDGTDAELQTFIRDSGIVAICADNLAVEADNGPVRHPLSKGYTLYPLHNLCLFRLGVYLGELWCFRDLAAWLQAHVRNRFFLTATPLNLPGAAGSPLTPIATV